MKTAEELIDSNRIIVVDGEYTNDTIKQAFSEGYEKGYNQALEDAVENVIMKLLNGIIVIDKDSILKLKK